MFGLSETSAFWAVAAINAAGILSLIVVRFRGNSVVQAWYQGVFFSAFALVGAAMIAAVIAGSGHWIWLAITTSVMVVGSSIDGGYSRQVRTI